jgi:Fe-S-cluster-containing hydrogenase component 2
MAKILMIDYEKCVGCGRCGMVCSAKHKGVINPSLSYVQIVTWPVKVGTIPIVCAQCQSAPCQIICPVKAISRDEQLDRVIVDYDICIGCRMCVAVCPFGGMGFDSIGKRIGKCDLCDGDPLCVRNCSTNALQYVDASEQSIVKQRAVAEKLSGIHKITLAFLTSEGS